MNLPSALQLVALFANTAGVPEMAWGVQASLLVFFGALVAGGMFGAAKWRNGVEKSESLGKLEKLQMHDGVAIISQTGLGVLVGLYAAMAAASACFPNRPGAMGLALLWALAGLMVGGVLGFLFGHPKIEQNPAQAVDERRTVRPNTSMDQIIEWLTKIIVGVGLVEAQRILSKGRALAEYIGQGMAAVDGAAQSPMGFALAAAVLVVFPIAGFVAVYLVTRTYVTLALCRAEVAASAAANGATVSEQTKFQINDEQFKELDKTPLQLGEETGALDVKAEKAAAQIVKEPLEHLEAWRHVRLWAKARLLQAMAIGGKQAEGPAMEAEAAYERAVEMVPNDAETRLGYAVALQLRRAAKQEVLSQLEMARDSLMAKSPKDVRKNVYKSLIYQYLFLPEPESFQKAIATAQEYFKGPDPVQSGGIWVNVACAYGLAVKWLAADGSRVLDVKNFAVSVVTVPEGTRWMGREDTLAWFRQAAVRAAREAISRDPKWRTKLRLLSGKEGTSLEGTDLESVKDDLTDVLGE